jgi:hypothetical protein
MENIILVSVVFMTILLLTCIDPASHNIDGFRGGWGGGRGWRRGGWGYNNWSGNWGYPYYDNLYDNITPTTVVVEQKSDPTKLTAAQWEYLAKSKLLKNT